MLTSLQSRFLRSARLNRVGKGMAYFGFAALLALTAATAQMASAQVASGTTGIDASGNARNEMAACASGKSQEDKATCMKEVRNANAEKRAGKLGNSGDFNANALMRCDVFKSADDQNACKARVMNDASAQGSVAGGGVLREAETVVPVSQ
ncbi:MAG: hypothetical protein ABI845_08815 [Polaromonas sp.]